MAKFQSPLLGYNNNVRHKNRVFHIQTEDSGVNHPHIITHLFMDGGRILKSVKKSYAEHVGVDGMQEIVRGLMKEQHKAIFIALRDGQFDTLVDGGTTQSTAKAASVKPAPSAAPVTEQTKPLSRPPSAPAAAAVSAKAPPASDPVVVPAPPTSSAFAVAATEHAFAAANLELAPLTIQDPRPPSSAELRAGAPTASKSARELTLDFDALDRASQEGSGSSLFHAADLPPPPKNMFAAKEPGSGGAYRAVEANPAHASERPEAAPISRSDPREEPDSPAPVSRPQRGLGSRSPSNRVQAEGRYAPARPAAIFGNTQRPPPASLFSDDLVSDKSLDEVILSYLAEDLEPPRRK